MITKQITTDKNKEVEAITFQIEELSPPENLLEEQPLSSILKNFSKRIEAHSQVDSSLVSYGRHSFIHGMYAAYAEHRPFVLSPDMIWLLIVQGFSCHVNFNHKTSREVFPGMRTKEPLYVYNDAIKLGDSSSPWAETTAEFTEQITDYIGEDLMQVLRADFSTTSMAERIATEITIMDAMKPYFEYVVMRIICGIPAITIEGRTEDWEKILEKLSYLKKYQLEDWVAQLNPIIQEFVQASKGIIDKQFWMNMFKVHTRDSYGAPKSMDGWICNFFPYNREGKRMDVKEISELDIESVFEELPPEIVCVEFEYRIVDSLENVLASYSMEYQAGFTGLKQEENFALRPEIGWFVNHKDNSQQIKVQGQNYERSDCSNRRYYNLTSFPKELFEGKQYGTIELIFIGEIDIPENLSEMYFDRLYLDGQISEQKISELRTLYPDKRITINNQYIHRNLG